MTTFTINGKAYPMALTLGAMEDMDALCGGFENAADAFEGKTLMETVQVLVQMLRILLSGGQEYTASMGGDPLEAPAVDTIKASLMPKDIPEAKTKVFQALAESMGRTVDVEPDPKNAETTPAD